MSNVVLGVGASHSTLMHAPLKSAGTRPLAARYVAGLQAAREAVVGARPDAAIIVGSNHFRGLWLDMLPAFTIGVGACTSSGEAGTPKGPLEVEIPLARHVCTSLVAEGYDLAMSLRLQVDHGISHAVQYLLTGMDIPIVPILINVFAAPLPPLWRCDDLGLAVARAVSNDGADKRVVVIGSGGLSHHLPFPKWEHPETDGERFLVEAWLEGRGRWEEYDARRRALTLSTEPRINREFDEAFLERVEQGALGELRTWDNDRLEAEAGNGGQEVRTWLTASAINGHQRGRRLSYDPVDEWLTGMAVATLGPGGELLSEIDDREGARA